MLVLGCFAVFRQYLMTFNLTDDGQGIDFSVFAVRDIGTQFYNLFPFLLLCFRIVVLFDKLPPSCI